jgi:hypothetical protein
MTANDDFDRTLAGWLEAESRSARPAVGIERVLDVTRRRRPLPAWLAQPGSHWIGEMPGVDVGIRGSAQPGLHLRWSTVAVLLLLGLAIAGGALLAAGQLTPRPRLGDAGGRLAYILDGVIYLADWDGHDPVRLGGASLSADSCDEVLLEGDVWSPDGRYIAYRSGHGTGCTPIVHISDDQGKPVTSWSAGMGWKAEWAPDARRVVSWGTADGTIDIHGVDGVLQAEVRVPDGFCVCGDYDPGWTPDGTSILLKSLLIPLDGAAPRPLLGGRPGSIKLGVREPSTSADGTVVTFVASGSLFLARVDDLTAARVLVEDLRLADPILSPTGDQIAVAASRNPVLDKDGYTASATYDLRVVDVASGQVTTLVTVSDIAAITPLAFSPVGDRILFRQVVANLSASSLWSVRTNGSDVRLLIAGAYWGDWQYLR